MPKKTTSKKITSKATSKAAAKKKTAAKSTKDNKATNSLRKFSDEKTKLIKDIHLLLEELNVDNLAFVLQQCGFMYNDQKQREPIDENRQNEIIQGKKRESSEVKIREADDGSYFIIEINNHSNFFTLNEMRKLVKMCHASEDEGDAARRIYKWFTSERQDVGRNSMLGGPGDISLKQIYEMIVSTYALKE